MLLYDVDAKEPQSGAIKGRDDDNTQWESEMLPVRAVAAEYAIDGNGIEWSTNHGAIDNGVGSESGRIGNAREPQRSVIPGTP